ncbi:MAG TPA: rRNA maturation RNase YbeY [Eubacteriales bacterium]|nr:rRNA maturation RNase YbeY [Eubacteriales bacterium]
MKIKLYNANLIERIFITKVLKTANVFLLQPDNLEIAVSFINPEQIRSLNYEFRKVDDVTDVLSFPLIDAVAGEPVSLENNAVDVDERTGRLSLGDIVICRDRAKKQATEYGHSYKREVCFLALHGYLHLVGYDHINEADARVMEQKQTEILARAELTREVK